MADAENRGSEESGGYVSKRTRNIIVVILIILISLTIVVGLLIHFEVIKFKKGKEEGGESKLGSESSKLSSEDQPRSKKASAKGSSSSGRSSSPDGDEGAGTTDAKFYG